MKLFYFLWISILGASLGTLLVSSDSHAAENAEAEVADLLDQFAKDWPDDRTMYRTEGDTSWTSYALTLSRLVALGDEAVPGLIAASSSPSVQVRAMCARTLGFLNSKTAVPSLIELLEDKNPAVALLAADSLGQIQDPAGLEALRAARKKQTKGDVLLHISKALERNVPLEDGVREQVIQITPETIDSAEVGQLAPEFTLQDATGKKWQLKDFRGKKSVLLVFIYGDG